MPANEPSSWSELLQIYAQQKHAHPKSIIPLKATPKPAFDPITSTWKSPTVEAQKAFEEKEKMTAQQQQAMKKASKLNRQFNIINNSPPPSHKSKQPHYSRDFNIVTLDSSTDSDENYLKNEERRRQAIERKIAIKEKYERKDYDFVGHRYYMDNGERKSKDEEENANEWKRKYWQTHHYNIISTTFYDPTEEQKFQLERNQVQHEHGESKLRRLPLRYQKSEGMSYNILAPPMVSMLSTGRDDDEFSGRPQNRKDVRVEEDLLATMQRRQIRENRERSFHNRMEETENLEGRRARAKRNIKRDEDINSRGYDIVTGNPIVTVNPYDISQQLANPKSESNPFALSSTVIAVYPAFSSIEQTRGSG